MKEGGAGVGAVNREPSEKRGGAGETRREGPWPRPKCEALSSADGLTDGPALPAAASAASARDSAERRRRRKREQWRPTAGRRKVRAGRRRRRPAAGLRSRRPHCGRGLGVGGPVRIAVPCRGGSCARRARSSLIGDAHACLSDPHLLGYLKLDLAEDLHPVAPSQPLAALHALGAAGRRPVLGCRPRGLFPGRIMRM